MFSNMKSQWSDLLTQLYVFSILGAVSGSSSGYYPGNETCCSILHSAMAANVLISGTYDLKTEIEPYWSAQAQDMRPSCVVQPRSTADVSKAVGILTAGFEAHLEGCDFAIRSGGHTPWPGVNNIDNGVTLDLSYLNQVVPIAGNTQVSVGPGNRWEDVYKVLDPLNLTVVGGRSRTVGVGGLVLSSGMSFFSGRYGLPCDNVVNYEVVLSGGAIVNVNNQSYSDLYTALRGGSNNFGVVTRLDLKAINQGKFWGGMSTYTASAIPQLINFTHNFTDSGSYDPYSQISFQYGLYQNQTIVTMHEHYTKAETPPFHVFGPLSSLQVQNTDRIDTMNNFAIELGSINDNGTSQRAFATATYRSNLDLDIKFAHLANITMNSLLGTVKIFVISVQPFGQIITDHQSVTGPNHLGLESSDGDRKLYCLTVEWENKEDNEKVYGAMKNLLDEAETAAQALNATDDYVFQNYAAPWQDVYRGVGVANHEAFQRASKKYDPSQLFQKAVLGGFKLF